MRHRRNRPSKAMRECLRVILEAPPGMGAWGLTICDQTGYRTGTVYPALNKLLKRGWLVDEWRYDSGVPARRRYYMPAYNPEWYGDRLSN